MCLIVMIVEPKGTELLKAFNASVVVLNHTIIDKADWIDKNDPDPITTKNFMVDKELRKWFMSGAGLGY